MHHLLITRHGTAGEAASDFDRPLTDAGVDAVRKLAASLPEHVPAPDSVLCSPARRTRDTLALLTHCLVHPSRAEFPESLYLASGAHLHEWVLAAPENTGVLMLVGHNPGVSELLRLLARETVQGALNTGTVVHLQAEQPWRQWQPGSADVVGIWR